MLPPQLFQFGWEQRLNWYPAVHNRKSSKSEVIDNNNFQAYSDWFSFPRAAIGSSKRGGKKEKARPQSSIKE